MSDTDLILKAIEGVQVQVTGLGDRFENYCAKNERQHGEFYKRLETLEVQKARECGEENGKDKVERNTRNQCNDLYKFIGAMAALLAIIGGLVAACKHFGIF